MAAGDYGAPSVLWGAVAALREAVSTWSLSSAAMALVARVWPSRALSLAAIGIRAAASGVRATARGAWSLAPSVQRASLLATSGVRAVASGLRATARGTWSLVPSRSQVWTVLWVPGWLAAERVTADGTSGADVRSQRTALRLLETLHARLDARDFAGATKLLDRAVDWRTPQWRARGRAKLMETWQSGVDDKWGVSPVWRPPAFVPAGPDDAAARRGQLLFTRECETFRVLGWPIRLRQTYEVARQGVGGGFVVRSATIERL